MRNRNNRKPLAEINVVPYIDVMLVLLVIFMITAPLLMQGVKISLPRAAAKPLSAQQQEPIIVSVNDKGEYFLNRSPHPTQPINTEMLLQAVNTLLTQHTNQPIPVLVRGDRDANYGMIVKAMTLLQKAGATNVGLMTQPTKA